MDMMEHAWYIKWFRMSEKVWDRFNDRNGTTCRERTNICTLIRVSTVYLFLSVGVNLLTWATILWLLIIEPAQTYGVTNYMFSLGGVAVITAAIASIIGISVFIDWLKYKRRAGAGVRKEGAAKRAKARAEAKAAKRPSFLSVVSTYIKGRHDKICVLINIKETNHV